MLTQGLTKRRKIHQGDVLFRTINIIFMSLTLIVTLYPLVFVLSASMSDPIQVNMGNVWLLPKKITWEGYQRVFRNQEIWLGYRNTVLYTFFGTIINLVVTIPAAYALSRKEMVGRGIITKLVLFTMFFSGGLIPTYMVIRNLGMLNTPWALLVPTAVSTYNLIVTRSFFTSSIPEDLHDAAAIDGCSPLRTFAQVVLPLAAPIIAVMALFYGIGHWNSYFNAMIYVNDRNLFPLQLFLREILIMQESNVTGQAMSVAEQESISQQQRVAELIKYVVIVVSTAPVLLIYPLMQKYFVRGVMIGSIKG